MKVIKSKSSKAGLIFPVARIDRYLRKCTHHYRISTATAIYIAAVMEYLTAEVLELAGAAAKDNRKRRITPRHILLAVANDDELKEMLKTVTIPSAGVIPNIIFLSNNVQKPLIKHKLQTSAKVHTNKKKQETKGNKKKQETKIYINKKQKTTKPKSTKSKRSNKTMKKKSSAVRPKQCIPQQNVPDKPNVKKYNPGDTPKVTILSEKKLFLGQRLTVVQGSIVDVMADAIVNPTNASFFMGGQVGKTLLQEGGEKFEKEVNDLKSANTLAPAAAAICPGYNFVAEYVIHCNGPTSYSNASIDLLKKTIKSCLSLADSKNLESLALPSIGSGRAGFPKVEAAKVILEAIGNYFSTVMSTSIKQIYFVLYDKESIDAYTKEILNLNI